MLQQGHLEPIQFMGVPYTKTQFFLQRELIYKEFISKLKCNVSNNKCKMPKLSNSRKMSNNRKLSNSRRFKCINGLRTI